MSNNRSISRVISAQPTSDGDGVKIRRITGFNDTQFSPFLMLDELKADDKADYIGGFPPHPHRGIETLTYMMNGYFQHRDHMGNVGELRSGGAQWMAAGRGVIHSEMPIMKEGQLHGFQIWINQPAKDKMLPARYHDFQPEVITEYQSPEQGLVRVLAGEAIFSDQKLTGPLTETGVALSVIDWKAGSNHQLQLKTPNHYQASVYVYQGNLNINGKEIKSGHLALLSVGDEISLASAHDAGALILMGEPINEPVVHYGPFVMNSIQEIEQAINDYNAGLFETY
jgi:quercetin 2,3-dioxygenase